MSYWRLWIHESKQALQWIPQGRREDGDPGTAGKGPGERHVDSRLEVQLKEDEGNSIRHSWMRTSGLSTDSNKAQVK